MSSHPQKYILDNVCNVNLSFIYISYATVALRTNLYFFFWSKETQANVFVKDTF